MWWAVTDATGWQQTLLDQSNSGLVGLPAGVQTWLPQTAPIAIASASSLPEALPRPVNGPGNSVRLTGRAAVAAKGVTHNKPTKTGLLARLSSHVQDFEDRLNATAASSEEQGAGPSAANTLREFVLRGIGNKGLGLETVRVKEPKSMSSAEVVDSDSDGIVVHSNCSQHSTTPRLRHSGRCSGREQNENPRSSASSSPHPNDSDNGYAELTCHLRSFLECESWNSCSLERTALPEKPQVPCAERLLFQRPSAWQRLRVACALDGATARGWVCSHVTEQESVLLRLVAVELPPDKEDLFNKGLQQGEGPLPLLPPATDDGFFGVLPSAGISEAPQRDGVEKDQSRSKLPSLGTLLRVRFVRGETAIEQQMLRNTGASCIVSMVSGGQSDQALRPLGVLSIPCKDSTAEPDREWPDGGAAAALLTDPSHFATNASARFCCLAESEAAGHSKAPCELLNSFEAFAS
eukprot:TRINITY_DN22798_c0_g1_i1.p1 TRINITY_DN22798_c0_g1~~TRINITY_DN22798_c0_g1_i1.p1  ORF type:complete len:464 (-),score=75.53 TRINITY_DN22798_c0_g1_i1:401-1792(-)